MTGAAPSAVRRCASLPPSRIPSSRARSLRAWGCLPARRPWLPRVRRRWLQTRTMTTGTSISPPPTTTRNAPSSSPRPRPPTSPAKRRPVPGPTLARRPPPTAQHRARQSVARASRHQQLEIAPRRAPRAPRRDLTDCSLSDVARETQPVIPMLCSMLSNSGSRLRLRVARADVRVRLLRVAPVGPGLVD